ncbi:hypothetical protein ACFSUK_16390 [Sphingobium scionense]
MRNHFLLALPLLLLAGCGSKEQNQSAMVTNILDQALPSTRDAPPGANAITPVEPAPDLPVAKGRRSTPMRSRSRCRGAGPAPMSAVATGRRPRRWN